MYNSVMENTKISVVEIKTQFINPPIPFRGCDWVAWVDGEEEDGKHGFGETESAAISALNDVIGRLTVDD